MHSKIINPTQHGRFVFSNRGSCQKTITYLGHEVDGQPGTAHFFNQDQQAVTGEEVREVIDRNAKGLRCNQEKFYSLVLSPSCEEITHLQNDPQKLKAFTVQAMENYARNFRFPHRPEKKLTLADLHWYATIHQTRKEKKGAEKGTLKTGNQAHIHILVSAQDQQRSLRLNPRSYRSRFSIRDWQLKNGQDFQQLFNYQKATVSEKLTRNLPTKTQLRHQARIRDKVGYLNQYFVGHWKLDENTVLQLGKEQHYGKGFFFRLHHLTECYQQGKPVNDPYRMLVTGKDAPRVLPELTLTKLGKQSRGMGAEAKEDIAQKRKKKHRESQPQVER
ncbi:DUF5712 family protein [Tunicatimonas pelagia]|uniref:DUF5712 family protein n=1 Tax=Tunicatimonas pelagia TaxID=931531 RepID=UPI0026657790|nr:DUF5712 family protein [Tunicatimonas pelagia]WKN44293.1 DUF5712 family protein [Tunicatimonas pelagia]